MNLNEGRQNLSESHDNSIEEEKPVHLKPKILNLNLLLNQTSQNKKDKNEENSKQDINTEIKDNESIPITNQKINDNNNFKRFVPSFLSSEDEQTHSSKEVLNDDSDKDNQEKNNNDKKLIEKEKDNSIQNKDKKSSDEIIPTNFDKFLNNDNNRKNNISSSNNENKKIEKPDNFIQKLDSDEKLNINLSDEKKDTCDIEISIDLSKSSSQKKLTDDIKEDLKNIKDKNNEKKPKNDHSNGNENVDLKKISTEKEIGLIGEEIDLIGKQINLIGDEIVLIDDKINSIEKRKKRRKSSKKDENHEKENSLSLEKDHSSENENKNDENKDTKNDESKDTENENKNDFYRDTENENKNDVNKDTENENKNDVNKDTENKNDVNKDTENKNKNDVNKDTENKNDVNKDTENKNDVNKDTENESKNDVNKDTENKNKDDVYRDTENENEKSDQKENSNKDQSNEEKEKEESKTVEKSSDSDVSIIMIESDSQKSADKKLSSEENDDIIIIEDFSDNDEESKKEEKSENAQKTDTDISFKLSENETQTSSIKMLSTDDSDDSPSVKNEEEKLKTKDAKKSESSDVSLILSENDTQSSSTKKSNTDKSEDLDEISFLDENDKKEDSNNEEKLKSNPNKENDQKNDIDVSITLSDNEKQTSSTKTLNNDDSKDSKETKNDEKFNDKTNEDKEKSSDSVVSIFISDSDTQKSTEKKVNSDKSENIDEIVLIKDSNNNKKSELNPIEEKYESEGFEETKLVENISDIYNGLNKTNNEQIHKNQIDNDEQSESSDKNNINKSEYIPTNFIKTLNSDEDEYLNFDYKLNNIKENSIDEEKEKSDPKIDVEIIQSKDNDISIIVSESDTKKSPEKKAKSDENKDSQSDESEDIKLVENIDDQFLEFDKLINEPISKDKDNLSPNVNDEKNKSTENSKPIKFIDNPASFIKRIDDNKKNDSNEPTSKSDDKIENHDKEQNEEAIETIETISIDITESTNKDITIKISDKKKKRFSKKRIQDDHNITFDPSYIPTNYIQKLSSDSCDNLVKTILKKSADDVRNNKSSESSDPLFSSEKTESSDKKSDQSGSNDNNDDDNPFIFTDSFVPTAKTETNNQKSNINDDDDDEQSIKFTNSLFPTVKIGEINKTLSSENGIDLTKNDIDQIINDDELLKSDEKSQSIEETNSQPADELSFVPTVFVDTLSLVEITETSEAKLNTEIHKSDLHSFTDQIIIEEEEEGSDSLTESKDHFSTTIKLPEKSDTKINLTSHSSMNDYASSPHEKIDNESKTSSEKPSIAEEEKHPSAEEEKHPSAEDEKHPTTDDTKPEEISKTSMIKKKKEKVENSNLIPKIRHITIYKKIQNFLNKSNVPFTCILKIAMPEDNANCQSFLIFSKFSLLVLKKELRKISISLKENIFNIIAISLAISNLVIIRFAQNSIEKKIEFQIKNPSLFTNSFNDHIKRILTTFEIKKINYNNLSSPRSLLKITPESILYRFNSLIKMNDIKISDKLNEKVIFSTHSNSFIFSKNKKRETIFPVLFISVLLNRHINQIKIVEPERIYPLILKYIEYFDNICHFIVEGSASREFYKFIEKSKNINSLSFVDYPIENYYYITHLIKKNKIHSIGFDSSITEKTLSNFITLPTFKNLSYFRVYNVKNVDFISCIDCFNNLSVLSLTSCNLKIGKVLETINSYSYQFNYLKELDLSGNIGKDFSNEINLLNHLKTLFVNDVKWKIDDLIIFLKICSDSSLNLLSMNEISFYKPILNKSKEKSSSKRKEKVENSQDEFIEEYWNSLFDNLPEEMKSISSLNWNSNKIDPKFINFLKQSKNLSYVSFSSCNVIFLSFIKDLMINSNIQSLVLSKIEFEDERMYSNNLKKFLFSIPQMKSLKQIEIRKNNFNSDCLETFSESLINSDVDFVYFDDLNLESKTDLLNFFKKLENSKQSPIEISFPIHEIHRLKMDQNEIDEINESLYLLSKPLSDRRKLSSYSNKPDIYCCRIKKSFPKFLTKKQVFEIEEEKRIHLIELSKTINKDIKTHDDSLGTETNSAVDSKNSVKKHEKQKKKKKAKESKNDENEKSHKGKSDSTNKNKSNKDKLEKHHKDKTDESNASKSRSSSKNKSKESNSDERQIPNKEKSDSNKSKESNKDKSDKNHKEKANESSTNKSGSSSKTKPKESNKDKSETTQPKESDEDKNQPKESNESQKEKTKKSKLETSKNSNDKKLAKSKQKNPKVKKIQRRKASYYDYSETSYSIYSEYESINEEQSSRYYFKSLSYNNSNNLETSIKKNKSKTLIYVDRYTIISKVDVNKRKKFDLAKSNRRSIQEDLQATTKK